LRLQYYKPKDLFIKINLCVLSIYYRGLFFIDKTLNSDEDHDERYIDTLSGKKFIRRKDLTPLVRLDIAYKALMAITFGLWGTITELSREHEVGVCIGWGKIILFA
jgi:hypothetical protein